MLQIFLYIEAIFDLETVAKRAERSNVYVSPKLYNIFLLLQIMGRGGYFKFLLMVDDNDGDGETGHLYNSHWEAGVLCQRLSNVSRWLWGLQRRSLLQRTL